MPEDEFSNAPPGGWAGMPVAPWLTEIYGPGRKFIWGNQFKLKTGQNNKRMIQIENLSAPLEFALHLRFTFEVDPLIAKWTTRFGVQGGPLEVNLFSGNHVVWGDSLIVDLSLIKPPGVSIIATAFAAPAPGATPSWQEG